MGPRLFCHVACLNLLVSHVQRMLIPEPVLSTMLGNPVHVLEWVLCLISTWLVGFAAVLFPQICVDPNFWKEVSCGVWRMLKSEVLVPFDRLLDLHGDLLVNQVLITQELLRLCQKNHRSGHCPSQGRHQHNI